MNFGEWKAKLYEQPGVTYIDLWLFRRTPAGNQVLTHKGEIKTLKEGSLTDPNDYFARFESMEQIHEVAEAFANYGVKTRNDHKNEGLLEATKYHLEDIRKIAKLSERKAK